MDNLILKSYSKILSPNVSRETCNEFESLISMIQRKNREINIISKKMHEKGLPLYALVVAKVSPWLWKCFNVSV